MPPRARRYDAERTRAAILAGAERVFVEQGYAAATVEDVAVASGVTKSLIHHYYGSKETLWEAVKTQVFGRYRAEQERMMRDPLPPLELVRRSIVMYFRWFENSPDFARLVMWNNLEGRTELGDRELMHTGKLLIAKLQADGVIRADIGPVHFIMAFMGMTQVWFQTRRFHPDWLGVELGKGADEAYLDSLLRIFFLGVVAEGRRDGYVMPPLDPTAARPGATA